MLALDGEPRGVLGKARGGVTGGVLGGGHVCFPCEAGHDALGGVVGRAFVFEDKEQKGSSDSGRIFLLKSLSGLCSELSVVLVSQAGCNSIRRRK